jgi:arsenite/tail-anchored protein-transporting ATPase
MALARLILVTGKGGAGKSTVAAALALALSRQRPTTLVDLDQRMSAARMLGIGPCESRAGVNCDSGSIADLDICSLSAQEELKIFIERIVPLKAIARRMLRSRTFGYVSAALPGLEAFLMLERLRILSARAAAENRFVVADAPATGSALELLSVAGGIKKIAPLGTLNRLAAGGESFLRDASRFAVMLTLTPHELALREALEAADILRGRLGVSVAAAALNCVPAALISASELATLGRHPECCRLAEWRLGAGRSAAHAHRQASRARLRVVELPMLFGREIGRRELEELSRALNVRTLRR